QQFYRQARPKQTRQALRRLPTLSARRRRLGEEDPGEDALFRTVGGPRRFAREIPGAERRPARWAEAPRVHRGADGEGSVQPLPEREASPGGHGRAVPALVGGVRADLRLAGRQLR